MIEFNIGDLIDERYKVVDEIGRGGMGIVLRCVDRESGDNVALKYCPSAEPAAQKRFGREVRIMAGINHKNVMHILNHSEIYDPPYFTMPIAAGSVANHISSALPIEEALTIFKEMCLGVQAIHGAGSTHRDLKPENAMQMEDGRIVISDLGLARLADRDSTPLTQSTAILGTWVYCAPEQFVRGGSREADERTDVFQLGKVLYELVTGDRPALIDPALIPPGLEHIIDRATLQHPDRRYQTVGQFMDAVENFVRAQDPNASAHSEFEAALERADALLEENKYSTENLERLLELLAQFGDDSEFYLEQFERISSRLLGVMAHRVPQQLDRPLRRYLVAVDDVIRDYNFSHAEIVASKMKAIFDSTEIPLLKVLALNATMVTAVRLNRFAAMEVYDQMIQAVSTTEVAIPVAEMLRENLDYYKYLSGRVPDAKLHAAIRQIPKED